MYSTCPKCGRGFGSAVALKQHFDSKSHHPYICDRCGKGFASQGATTQHLYDAHIDGKCQQDVRKQNDKQYQEARHRFPCDMRPRDFYSREALRKHKSSPAHMPSPRPQANPTIQASPRKQIERYVPYPNNNHPPEDSNEILFLTAPQRYPTFEAGRPRSC